ncbi:MAG: AAA family ATPase, partial [Anaeromyxobacteraceae bacterium]
MRIRRLEMVGFKSFMDRTVVAFDEGVTGVVGPNGCGKSNVADAIRWVLGEQSALRLRGRSMEDVIFNGSESKPPLSFAEVTLTFENDRPAELPPAFRGLSEITVGRRLYRTGESDYLVNRAPARLLDVNDIFFGSGVGRTAYSIIEQGRIGQIVSARAEDRRGVIEEAAGITKYKKRREAAERKMEATRHNLERVTDIVAELGKQLDSLNRQARKAEKYRAVKAQIRELELHVGAARWLELTVGRREAEERHAAARGDEAEIAARLSQIDQALEADRALLAERELTLQQLSDREHELESQGRVSAVSTEAAERELDQIAERSRGQASEVEALKVQTDALAAERDALLRQRDELASLSGSDEAHLAGLEGALRAAALEQGSVAAEGESARD